jgi:pantetheine-phosphate adenylyltransferase
MPEKKVYCYFGSFDPPTYGHAHIAQKAIDKFKKLYIVVADNPDKKHMYLNSMRQEMWGPYNLTGNFEIISVNRLKELAKPQDIVMVRGIRDGGDLKQEQAVERMNRKYGITQFKTIKCDEKYKNISSSQLKKSVKEWDFENMKNKVNPLILSQVICTVHRYIHFIIVAGRPGSGKSTWVKKQVTEDPHAYSIDTDNYNEPLQEIIKTLHSDTNFFQFAHDHQRDLDRILKPHWFEMLKRDLKNIPENKTEVYIQVPWALQEHKKVYKYLGGDIMYFDCPKDELLQRNLNRNTPHLAMFIDQIPDLKTARKIAYRDDLFLIGHWTGGKTEITNIDAYKATPKIKEE